MNDKISKLSRKSINKKNAGLREDENGDQLYGEELTCPNDPTNSADPEEPRHEKTCFCHMRTTKVQISLHIRG